MPRIARIVWPGLPYHVTHRGNRGQNLFYRPKDQDLYLGWLSDYGRHYGLDIWAYCLMSNHVHLLVVPQSVTSLADTIGRTHGRFASWQNHRNGWSGHLWANRFYSTPLDGEHLWTAVRYIELNPVRAGLVDQADAYPWSSARSHCRGTENNLLSPSRPFPGPISSWNEWLGLEPPSQTFDELRRNTTSGRPTGSPEFVGQLERRLERVLTPTRPGRRVGA